MKKRQKIQPEERKIQGPKRLFDTQWLQKPLIVQNSTRFTYFLNNGKGTRVASTPVGPEMRKAGWR
jgi:hypothetical protein